MDLVGKDKGNSWQEKELKLRCICCGNTYKAKYSELTMINDVKSTYNYSWSCPNCGMLNKK